MSRTGLPPDLMRAVYAQLRELAGLYIAGRRGQGGTILQATSLVHEAFVRLARNEDQHWESETHFVAVAATVMRRVLIDEIRARTRQRRGGGGVAGGDGRGWIRLELHELENEVAPPPHDNASQSLELLALDEALSELATLSPRQARIVELRYFGGLSVPQTAEVLGVSTRTVEKDWTVARAWLKRRIEGRP